jgi:DnaK suppressor protein
MASARSGLTKVQLDTLRKKLEDERGRLGRVLQEPTPTLPTDDERVEFEETAQRATERTQQVEIAERERALLAEVERAIAKFAVGTYGISEATGAPIPYPRLAAVPWARRDVDE